MLSFNEREVLGGHDEPRRSDQPGALFAALQEGRPVFAAVDVYEEEPMLDVNYSFFAMGTVVCTPHIGYVARDE